jgi:glycosyltransferase involved in cell wall biosynthesis
MKIALLSEKYTPDIGGLAISTDRFARALASAGYAVRVFVPTLSLPPSEKRTLISGGVSVTRFGAHKRVDDTLVDWFELIVEEHKREPFDVLHAYFLTQAGFVATHAGKYLGIPSVVSIRGNDIERAPFDPSRFSHGMYALQNANAVTANASELVKKAKAFIDREIVLIPNGIDAEHFKPMERNEVLIESIGIKSNVTLSKAQGLLHHDRDSSVAPLPQSDITSIIGFVGELREKKGIKALLSAYAQINKHHPATLLIVGEVRQGEDKQFFDEFKLANQNLQIIVTGYVLPKDLPAYYSLMDVFVHPSLRDGMPNAVLEAMACGKTVIATPVGGVLDVIEDGVNGLLAPVNDAEGLAEKIVEALSQSGKRETVGRSARETVLHRFTLENELKANLQVYKTLGVIK